MSKENNDQINEKPGEAINEKPGEAINEKPGEAINKKPGEAINNKPDETKYALNLVARIQEGALRERVENALLWYIRRAKRSKFWYYTLSITGIISGAIVPVINSFSCGDGYKGVMTSIVAVLGSIAISICTLFNFKESWLRNRSFAEAIKSECFNFVNQSGQYFGLEKKEIAKAFTDNFNSILVEEGRQWNETKKVSEEKGIKSNNG